jgi:hypothetical protein
MAAQLQQIVIDQPFERLARYVGIGVVCEEVEDEYFHDAIPSAAMLLVRRPGNAKKAVATAAISANRQADKKTYVGGNPYRWKRRRTLPGHVVPVDHRLRPIRPRGQLEMVGSRMAKSAKLDRPVLLEGLSRRHHVGIYLPGRLSSHQNQATTRVTRGC